MVKLTEHHSQEIVNKIKTYMKEFHSLCKEHNYEPSSTMRSIVAGGYSEEAIAQTLREAGHHVVRNGDTGMPDLIVDGKELECKFTTASGGRITFQTDMLTIAEKEVLDYIYVVVDDIDKIQNAAVFLFSNLTRDDFSTQSERARGKVQLRRSKGMPKAEVFIGSAEPHTKRYVQSRLEKLQKLTPKAIKTRQKIVDELANVKNVKPRWSISLGPVITTIRTRRRVMQSVV